MVGEPNLPGAQIMEDLMKELSDEAVQEVSGGRKIFLGYQQIGGQLIPVYEDADPFCPC